MGMRNARNIWLVLLMLAVFAVILSMGSGSAFAAGVTLGATGGDGKVALSWTATVDIKGLQVMRDTDANPSGRLRVAILPGSARSYTDNTVVNGHKYWYWIKYTDVAGKSGNSNGSSATAGSKKVVNYTLDIGVSGNGSTSVTAGSHSYKTGSSVTIKATPAQGSVFSGWSGAFTGNTNPLTLMMNGNKSLTATFTVKPVDPPPPPPPTKPGVATSWGTISEPTLPGTVCTALAADLDPVNGSIDALDSNPSDSQPDTSRIQNAIDSCPSGQAVKLTRRASGASGFLSAPLKLKSGVKLWIDDGVTLFASRNPADYDNGPGSCGTATAKDVNACDAFIVADGTTGSGIVGGGAIDGRGGSLLTSGPNAGHRSWWDVAWQNKSEGLSQQNPRLIQINSGSDFTFYKVAILNSPNFHIVTNSMTGVTAWGIRILSPSLVYTRPGYACPANSTPDKTTPATCFTPETVKNTDGFDPSRSSKVLLAYSYISTGDDNVAVKSSNSRQPSTNLAFVHNHFYYGHGMSIGSETDAGLSDMVVTDLAIDGQDSTGSVGLRIKSDASRGGDVDGVTYSRICMRNVRQPLVFDSFYSSASGAKYPRFTNIKVSGFHDLGSTKYGGGQVTFAGYDLNGQNNPLSITLDNVVFDGTQPTFAAGHNGGPSTLPAATHFILGPGAVSFAPSIKESGAGDVTVDGAPGTSTPVDCGAAFVPLHSVLPSSPI
jgi:polygalacturonase